ncbi:MAG: terminase small subunit [Candidatus Thiodiazotropha lotti]|nr:terminase small subunit [Candidatus Thiodiazotropha lotti]
MSEAFDKLNLKQQQFVLEYTKDFNGAQAAIRAGYSAKTARTKAAQLLAIVSVQSALQEEVAKIQEDTRDDAKMLREQLREEVTADYADLYNDDGSLKKPSEWPMAFRRGLVSGMKIEAVSQRGDDSNDIEIVTVKEVKLADRTKIKELFGKHKAVQAFDKEQGTGEIHIHIEGKDSQL